jgi:MOSC domain-containing protein YiiM
MRVLYGFMQRANDNGVMEVTSVNVGSARRIGVGARTVMSAIGKRPVAGRVGVLPLGLVGDEQADLSVHGGLSKAVYAYPSEHFDFWRTVRAQAGVSLWDAALEPGTLGENLTLSGLAEDRVWVGDVLRFPQCALAVSEPRQPCFKFNAAMGFAQAAKLMVQSGWSGFYLAVREPGTIAAGEAFVLEPGPREVRIDELFRAITSSHRVA